MAKLRLLADAWRQVQYDDMGRRTGFRRYRNGDEVEVQEHQVERMLNMKRLNKPLFERVGTEEKKEESKPATQTVTRTASSDRK